MRLLPEPQRCERRPGNLRGAALDPQVTIGSSAFPKAEGYRLTIDFERIAIEAHDAAGAFYAQQTLAQLRREAGDEPLPCLDIEDWPDFAVRGALLDISRDKVPRMETLFAQVDLLSGWKINQLQLYTEHTFAYRDHREVWEEASPLTCDEVRALDAHCRERHVELVPNQNSFGHMERWLSHPRYAHLAEVPETGVDTSGYRSLCPIDPGAIELIGSLYDELLPCFTSRQLNVGCDETVDLGKGRSAAACAARGVGRVYLEFLLAIHERVRAHGHTMQFWGDIILNHPELIPELPRDAIALNWGYEADHPFAEEGRRFAEAGVRHHVCPGTSSWLSIAGRTDNALENIRNAVDAGRLHGAAGCLITDWGDHGHWQPLPVAWLGLARGAALAWAADANRDADHAAALDAHVFHDAAGVMGRLVHDLGNAYRETGLELKNASALALLLLFPDRPLDTGRLAGLTVEGLERADARVAATIARIDGARMARDDAALIGDEWRLAADLLRHATRLGRARLAAEGQRLERVPAAKRRALADDLGRTIADYRRIWLARNRPGGLSDSVGRLEALAARYRS